MQRVRSVSFSRDNLIHLITKTDFFEKNPGLVSQQEDLADCTAKYRESIASAGCSCRANTGLMIDCLERLLLKLEAARDENTDEGREIVRAFVNYSTNILPRENEKLTLTVYFKKTGVADTYKYEFSI
jgi:hypothetical protein